MHGLGLRGFTLEHLRVCRADLLDEYLRNTNYLVRYGNEAFSRHIRARETTFSPTDRAERFLLYHAWMRAPTPFVDLDADEAQAVHRAVVSGTLPMPTPRWLSRALEMGWTDDVQLDIVALVNGEWTGPTPFLAVQNRKEQVGFLRFLLDRRLNVVVEIGTARGGMLYCFAQLAAADALVVSIDLPAGANCGGQTAAERQLFESFAKPSQAIRFIPSDSHAPATRDRLVELLGDRPIDLLFIDGDHTYSGVRRDFELYAPLVAPGGLVAFHDIEADPEEWAGAVDVRRFWRELAASGARCLEFVDRDGVTKRHQLGPGERYAWGIGVHERPDTTGCAEDSGGASGGQIPNALPRHRDQAQST